MWSQLILFIAPLFISIISIIIGILMLKFPPKEINMLYGYRTRRSMSNQNNWDFSQKFSAQKMIQVGITILTLSFMSCLFEIPKAAYSVVIITGITIGVLSLISIVILTEQKLKQKQ